MTLKFEGWPSKTIGHLFNATSSFVHHFGAIGEFKLELQFGNAQSGSNSTIFTDLIMQQSSHSFIHSFWPRQLGRIDRHSSVLTQLVNTCLLYFLLDLTCNSLQQTNHMFRSFWIWKACTTKKQLLLEKSNNKHLMSIKEYQQTVWFWKKIGFVVYSMIIFYNFSVILFPQLYLNHVCDEISLLPYHIFRSMAQVYTYQCYPET